MCKFPIELSALLLVSTALIMGNPGLAQARQIAVELELVLAVDTSASVDDAEYRLQMSGIAHSFRDRDVIAAIESFGGAGIAVAMIHWSATAARVTSWSHIVDSSGSLNFAAQIEVIPRSSLGVTTGIGTALALAQLEFATNGFAGRRRSIDVSGDGKNNSGLPLWRQRTRATSAGITINGLAVLDQDPLLKRYYGNHVIGGNGAFVITAANFRDFARAFRQKLLREIQALVTRNKNHVPHRNFARR